MAALALLCAAALAVNAATGSADWLLHGLPLLALALPLLAGRFLGERTIVRLTRARSRALAPRRLAPAPRALLRPRASMLRGGRLIAASLAKRPPPTRLATS